MQPTYGIKSSLSIGVGSGNSGGAMLDKGLRVRSPNLLPDHFERHPHRALAVLSSDPRIAPWPQAARWCRCRSLAHASATGNARQSSVQATAAGSMGPNVRFREWSGKHIFAASILRRHQRIPKKSRHDRAPLSKGSAYLPARQNAVGVCHLSSSVRETGALQASDARR